MQGPLVELAAGLGYGLWALGIWSDHDLPCACAVIFVDWDDTILSSTVLTRTAGLRVDEASPLDPRLVEELRALEMDALRFIEECQTRGTMVIVTNAETGWVQLSGKRFLPRVLDALMKYDVRIMSARSAYEPKYPNSPTEWKQAAFMECVLAKVESDTEAVAMYGHGTSPLASLNLVSIGDSVSERKAAHFVGTQVEAEIKVKTVKFVERPDIEKLRRQLMLVTNNLGEICAHPASFDVNLVC